MFGFGNRNMAQHELMNRMAMSEGIYDEDDETVAQHFPEEAAEAGLTEEDFAEEEGEEENEESLKEKKWKKDRLKMQVVAGIFASKRAPSFVCPRCHRPSIYFEPPLIKTAMDSAWSEVMLVRMQRFVCFNPSCPMNFIHTRTRFKVNVVGKLKPTHILGDHLDKNPFMPI